MGWGQSKRSFPDPDEDVNFDHFEILRAIGKGSFGKVCIVQKRGGTSNMYAMKYVHKDECAERGALRNIVREVEILSELEHPNLVNLWFSFQDEEDLFMVSDLLLGGDLRYHIQQQVQFTEQNIVLYVAEIALALDYLQDHKIIHRDIKPDNILLDEDGHARVTDFNIATVLQEGRLATSMSGTKPYIAPEIYMCSCDENGVLGYGYPVDWWSLGVLAWETMAGTRPYPLHSTTSHREAIEILQAGREAPSDWTPAIKELLDRLLTLEPGRRISTLRELKEVEIMSKLDFDKILRKEVKPDFAPPKDHLNCDPTFELEEMIIETKPLHKKKKRLAKQRSLKVDSTLEDTVAGEGAASDPRRLTFIPEYRVYNRERELEKREMERKEDQWQEELDTAMENAGERMSKSKGENEKRKGNKQKPSPTPSMSTAATASVTTSCCLLTVPSRANVKARINASPRLGVIRKHATTSSSSDIDYIDATPGPSTSK